MRSLFVCFVLTASFASADLAQEPAKAAKGSLIVVNTDGKEHALKNWKIILGTRHLILKSGPFKAPAKNEKLAPKENEGPEYLEFREEHSTTFEKGILTLIPITSIRRLDYDDAKKTVSVTMVQDGDKEVVLTGTTKYNGINKLTIEGEIDAKDLDGATVRVQGGMPGAKPAVKSFRFPHMAVPPPKVKGPAVIISAVAKENFDIKVHDIKALYNIAGHERVSSILLFKKHAKIDLAKIAKMKHVQVGDKKQVSWDYDVSMNDGTQFIFTLIRDTFPDDDSPAQLQGLIGMVPAGYRLFPPHTIAEMRKEE